MDSLFSSTSDTVAPLRLRKIEEKSPTPWYNEHTRALKRAARKMERSWRKTKLEAFRMAWRESNLTYRKALKTARSDYFSSLLEENKHNPRYLFNTVAKYTKYITSAGVVLGDISQQHSSNDFINYFTSKTKTIRDQTVTMQPPAAVSHQIVHYRSPEEQLHSFSTIGEEELYELGKSATCMLDPIPSKLLKEVLPEVMDPLLAIINSSLSLGYVPKTFKLAVIKPLSTTWPKIIC